MVGKDFWINEEAVKQVWKNSRKDLDRDPLINDTIIWDNTIYQETLLTGFSRLGERAGRGNSNDRAITGYWIIAHLEATKGAGYVNTA